MNCPNCTKELVYKDWYGTNMKFNGSGNKKGNIYSCENESCESYEEHFHTRNGELQEGYPC